VGTPTRCLQHLVASLPRRHPEIGDLDILLGGQHDILGFEIPVADPKAVTVVQTSDDLLKVLGSLVGFERTGRDEVFEELSALNVFEYQVAASTTAHVSIPDRFQPGDPLTSCHLFHGRQAG
jgi:hypothetical protein